MLALLIGWVGLGRLEGWRSGALARKGHLILHEPPNYIFNHDR